MGRTQEEEQEEERVQEGAPVPPGVALPVEQPALERHREIPASSQATRHLREDSGQCLHSSVIFLPGSNRFLRVNSNCRGNSYPQAKGPQIRWTCRSRDTGL